MSEHDNETPPKTVDQANHENNVKSHNPEESGKTPDELAREREDKLLAAADSHAMMMLLEELEQLDRALAMQLTGGFNYQVARVVQRFNYACIDYELKGSGTLISALAICVRRRNLRYAWIERALLTDAIRVGGESGVRRNLVALIRGQEPATYWLGDAPISLTVRDT